MRRKTLSTATILMAGSAFCFAQDAPPIKVVTGAPFSARLVTESTQTLADGNRIVRTSAVSVARDSEGRTRREQSPPNGSVVFITDPIAGENYVLESRSRTARRFASAAAPTESRETATPGIAKESLGTQLIENVQADGTRITRTIPAGQMGNERPFEIVSEFWYSPELQTTVVSDIRDPRRGEISAKLTDIQRGEPDHSLFEIPADYTVVRPGSIENSN